MKTIGNIIFGLTLLMPISYASSENGIELLPFKGMGSVEFGALEQVHIASTEIYNRESLVNGSVWLFQGANLAESFQTHLGIGVMTFSVMDRQGVPNAQFRRMVPVLARASGKYTLGGREQKNYWLGIEAGMFPFKYNPYASNLGEYMFRTRVMPIQIRTGGLDVIETAGSFLTGLHLDGHLGGNFNWDLLYTYNMDRLPLKSQSVTLMSTYKKSDVFELGLGIQLESKFFDTDSLLSPKSRKNMSYHVVNRSNSSSKNFNASTLDGGLYQVCPAGQTGCADSVKSILGQKGNAIGRSDIFSGGLADTLYNISDSAYYSFSGAKVILRAALNLQPILKINSLGPKDLTIYFETAILGLKSIPVYGESIQERMPIMFGMNLPTFKILDQLTFEMEVFKLKYPMNDDNVQNQEVPNYTINDAGGNYSDDDWKFSLMAKKTVVPGLELFVQVARDHMRTIDFYGKENYWEITQRNGNGISDLGDWYWLTRVKYYF